MPTDLTTIIPLIAMIAVFYFLLIRPQQKRDKATKELRNNLEVGDKLTTIGGITGTILNIKDDDITIETGADRTKITFKRWAVSMKDSPVSDDEKA